MEKESTQLLRDQLENCHDLLARLQDSLRPNMHPDVVLSLLIETTAVVAATERLPGITAIRRERMPNQAIESLKQQILQLARENNSLKNQAVTLRKTIADLQVIVDGVDSPELVSAQQRAAERLLKKAAIVKQSAVS